MCNPRAIRPTNKGRAHIRCTFVANFLLNYTLSNHSLVLPLHPSKSRAAPATPAPISGSIQSNSGPTTVPTHSITTPQMRSACVWRFLRNLIETFETLTYSPPPHQKAQLRHPKPEAILASFTTRHHHHRMLLCRWLLDTFLPLRQASSTVDVEFISRCASVLCQ